MRGIKTVDWDGIYIVMPYGSTDLLKDEYTGPRIDSSDDGDISLVFLKQKEYVAHIRAMRDVDFSVCREPACDQIIPKEKARFVLQKKEYSWVIEGLEK